MIWNKIEKVPKDGTPILLWSIDFIDEDFNPTGIIDGYFDEQLGWMGAVWDGCRDSWETKEYLEPSHFVDKEFLFSVLRGEYSELRGKF